MSPAFAAPYGPCNGAERSPLTDAIVDDRIPIRSLRHVRARDACEIEEVAQDEIERLVPRGVVELDGAAPTRLADHVDRDVDRTECLYRGIERGLHVVAPARVTDRARPVGAPSMCAAAWAVSESRSKQEIARAGRGQRAHAGAADAAADAGDERVLPSNPSSSTGGQIPEGRFSLFFACLSARFSFSDLPAFLLFVFFGDLSATGAPRSVEVRMLRAKGRPRRVVSIGAPLDT